MITTEPPRMAAFIVARLVSAALEDDDWADTNLVPAKIAPMVKRELRAIEWDFWRRTEGAGNR